MSSLAKLPPCNIEAEQGVLGSILYQGRMILPVAEMVQPEDFYRDAHRTIYEAMLELDRKHEHIDAITLPDLLMERGQLEGVGGSFYVTGLTQYLPIPYYPEEYAKIVAGTAQRRRLQFLAGKIAQLAQDETNSELAIAKSEEWLRALALGKRNQGNAQDIETITADYIERLNMIQQQRERGIVFGVPTGFHELDKLLGGMQKGDLLTLAARPGRGKTALALSIARQVMHFSSGLGYRTLMFSLEMSKWQLAQRMLSMESGINQAQLRAAWLNENDWDEVVQAQCRIPTQRLWIDDEPGLSVQAVRSRARRQQAEHGLDFVIVDYLQLMSAYKDDGSDYQNRVEEVDKISRELKNLARELDVPVLALAQLSRAVEQRQEKIPQLSDLRESGGIEQNSDIVLFPWENPQLPPNEQGRIVDLIIAKHRQGECGTVQLFFRQSLTKFETLAVTVSEEPAFALQAPKQIAPRQKSSRAWNAR